MEKTIQTLQDTYTLSNGIKIPCVGYGTYKMTDGENTTQAILNAIACGYRHIDTASFYQNEKNVGDAVRKSGIDRKDLFITSKVWRTDRGYQNTLKAFEKSINELQLDYLDLYLIHWPAPKKDGEAWVEENLATWQALMQLYNEGKVRAIGVSNFLQHHLDALLQTPIKPMVNQIQVHPGWQQKQIVAYCQQQNILVEAWSPLGRGIVLDHPTLQELAKKYQKTPAQLCVRSCLQKGILPLPKTVSTARMQENADVFDFQIAPTDMEKIEKIQIDGFAGHNPDAI